METFIIDWPILLLIGIGFGALAPGEGWWRSRAFAAGGATAVVFTAVALVSYVLAPDWMWMYFLDPDEVVWAVPVIVLGYLLFFVLGFAASVSLRSIGISAVAASALGAGVLELAVVAITWDRYHLIGTRAEWLQGRAHELLTAAPEGSAGPIGAMGAAFLVVVGVAWLLAWKARREAPADR
ncbi:MAG: hypothetical protein ABR575_01400 [Actinomycetota bacterium]